VIEASVKYGVLSNETSLIAHDKISSTLSNGEPTFVKIPMPLAVQNR